MSFLLVVTIVALGFSHFVQSQKYSKLKTEHEKLRKDFDVIDITDPNVIHAIGVARVRDYRVRHYRIYLPPDKKYVLRYASNDIPEKGFDVHGGSIEIPQGTFSTGTEELSIGANDDGDGLVVDINLPMRRWSLVGGSKEKVAPDIIETSQFHRVLPSVQSSGKKGEPFQLERRLVWHFSKNIEPADRVLPKRTKGHLLWIEEASGDAAVTPGVYLPAAKTEN